MRVEQQGTESGRGDGASEGGQLTAARSRGVAGAELSASQADLGAVPQGRAKALQHGNCGRHSNRAYGEGFRRAVLEQVRSRYEDFGPTLAAEHLASEEGIEVHAETLRRWMREAGLWRRARRRQPYRSWRTAWRNLTKAAGLKGLRFHDLRHQAITELAERSRGDQTIMSIAGHVSPEMLNHYSHIRLESKRRALETLEEPLLVASESQDNGAAPRPN